MNANSLTFAAAQARQAELGERGAGSVSRPRGHRVARFQRVLLASDPGVMDTTVTQPPASVPAWRAVLRPLITSGEIHRGLTHNLLGLPLGVVYFTWLVTGLSAGLGLS